MAHKFHNKKCSYNGLTFDSKHERDRYCELLMLQKAGVIHDLRCQVQFLLIPEYREPDTLGPRMGRKRGRIIEKACYYVADFVYLDEMGKTVAEDAKGCRDTSTAAYAKFVIKRKLMLHVHGIRVREV